MRFYEDRQKTSENRLSPRSYYIPQNKSEYLLLNGEWRFKYLPLISKTAQEQTPSNTK